MELRKPSSSTPCVGYQNRIRSPSPDHIPRYVVSPGNQKPVIAWVGLQPGDGHTAGRGRDRGQVGTRNDSNYSMLRTSDGDARPGQQQSPTRRATIEHGKSADPEPGCVTRTEGVQQAPGDNADHAPGHLLAGYLRQIKSSREGLWTIARWSRFKNASMESSHEERRACGQRSISIAIARHPLERHDESLQKASANHTALMSTK